jgi:hypothetical protein
MVICVAFASSQYNNFVNNKLMILIMIWILATGISNDTKKVAFKFESRTQVGK